MQTKYIKKVEIFSVGKILAVVYGMLGLLVAAFMGIMALRVGLMMGAGLDMLSGFGPIVMIPIFYAMTGYVSGVIFGVIFNGTAGLIGGLELDIE